MANRTVSIRERIKLSGHGRFHPQRVALSIFSNCRRACLCDFNVSGSVMEFRNWLMKRGNEHRYLKTPGNDTRTADRKASHVNQLVRITLRLPDRFLRIILDLSKIVTIVSRNYTAHKNDLSIFQSWPGQNPRVVVENVCARLSIDSGGAYEDPAGCDWSDRLNRLGDLL